MVTDRGRSICHVLTSAWPQRRTSGQEIARTAAVFPEPDLHPSETHQWSIRPALTGSMPDEHDDASMPGQRLRRWPDIDATSCRRPVFVGVLDVQPAE